MCGDAGYGLAMLCRYANQFRLLLSSLGYILLESIRRLALKGTELENPQAGALRLKLLKIGTVILHNTRRIRFLLSSHYPYRIYSDRWRPDCNRDKGKECCPGTLKNNGEGDVAPGICQKSSTAISDAKKMNQMAALFAMSKMLTTYETFRLESTVRYLGIEVDDALEISELTDS